MERVLDFARRLIPTSIFKRLQAPYHYLLAVLGAIFYRFPSRKLTVVAVTGTKGKTTVTELVSAILEAAGHRTAVSNTVRFKIGEVSERNLYKMSMPGRFFIQRFLRRAISAGCDYAVIEITSEAARLYRHKFIALDTLIFTNLAPEHIESHGSYEKYLEAKLSIGKALAKSNKERRIIVANADDKESGKFLALDVPEKYYYSLTDAQPYSLTSTGIDFSFCGQTIRSPLSGQFNLYNILAATTFAKTQNIEIGTIKKALENFSGVPGRVERISAGQDFTVIVDYAHTPDSLEKLYDVFQNSRRICVLGNTGGGRDKWKRPEMAKIAQRHCDEIILANEDPYDEDPLAIIDDMKKVITEKPVRVIVDRREAIHEALKLAKTGDVVLITGKGTDPYIMGAKGDKIPWSDAEVAKEEIGKLIINT
jgi:UDP-N-acetylmuramoyl-L-alanyl-D-glutamate--2,6-diaminopimelate ligase